MTSLRERVLALALREAQAWGDKPVAVSRVAEYLQGCERNHQVIGGWLASELEAGKSVSFCAAARGWLERQVAQAGELLPPWRAGAREVMRDSKSRGTWVPVEKIREGYLPPPGCVLVYWRVSPGGPFGHVETLIECSVAGYTSIGANENGGRWYRDAKQVSWLNERLLGAVVDDDFAAPAVHEPQTAPGLLTFIEPVLSADEIKQIENLQFTYDELTTGVPRYG